MLAVSGPHRTLGSRPRGPRGSERLSDQRAGSTGEGTLVAAPYAAAAAIEVARWLPIEFEFRESDVGLVSGAAQLAYPHQQDTFWWIFGTAVFVAITGGLGIWLRDVDWNPRRTLMATAATVSVLLCTLLLPSPFGLAAVGGGGVGLVLLAARAPRAARVTASESAPDPFPALTGAMGWPWVVTFALLSCALTPTLWPALSDVLAGTPDERLLVDSWDFYSETGQHLFFADHLMRGGSPGRDYYTPFAPLYDVGLVALWSVGGRSLAMWNLYEALLRAGGQFAAFLLCGFLLRRPWLALALPFLASVHHLRVGFALATLAFAGLWLRRQSRWGPAVGACAGVSLWFSQEFGIAVSVALAVILAVRFRARDALDVATGLLAVTLAVVGYFAWVGGAVEMLGDLLRYPLYIMAGYLKLPFPSLMDALPLSTNQLFDRETRILRMAYLAPVVCTTAILLLLPLQCFSGRRPIQMLRSARRALAENPRHLLLLATAVFGVLAFRYALGRSDPPHIIAVFVVPAILLVAALDGLLDGARRLRIRALWLGYLLVLLGIGVAAPGPQFPLQKIQRSIQAIASGTGREPSGTERMLWLRDWIQQRTAPGEEVLFLPYVPVYYYLTERSNPTRFGNAYLMVTDAHRAEALADLRADPPRFIVWDRSFGRFDDIPDPEVFGVELLGWIQRSYRVAAQTHWFVIQERSE